MSNTSPPSTAPASHAGPSQLKVSAQERVAGVLVALLLLIGMTVAVLIVLWLANRALITHPPVAVELVEELGGREQETLGAARELEPPGADEIELDVPPQLTETLAAVTDAISTQRAALEELDGPSEAAGSGSGRGDARAVGTGGEGTADVVPRGQRWEIRFASSSVEAYAQQLDYFKIELGVFGGGRSDVVYASQVAQDQRTVRTAESGAQEKRLNLGWVTGSLREFDRQLLARADVSAEGRIIRQFYSPEVENELAVLEQKHAGSRELREIAKTVFGVQSSDGKHEFYIIEQRYRERP